MAVQIQSQGLQQTFSLLSEKDAIATGESRKVSFKDPNYQRTQITLDKKRTCKSLKQIVALERSLSWDNDSVHYSMIDTPPSVKPVKKYSDISGCPAKYRDPTTGLYYAFSDEFSIVKILPSDLVLGYLNIRKVAPNN